MKRLVRYKKYLVATLCLCMILSLVGCKKKEEEGYKDSSTTKVMVVGDYDVYLDEVIMYSMQVFFLQGADSQSWSEGVEKNNRETVISLVRENKILYDVAVNNDVTLNEADLEYVQTTIDGFKSKFSQDILDKYGITDETIQRVFEEQAIITKFENDTRNDMAQTMYSDFTEVYADYNFYSMYYMLFPTVQVGDDGNPVLNDDGTYAYVSESEKEEIYANASAAVEDIRAGKSYEEVATTYGVTDYSSSRISYAGANNDEELDAQIGALNAGECTEVFEDTLGYVVVVMVSPNDEEIKDDYVTTLVNSSLSDEFEALKKMWLGTIAINETEDMEGTVWDDFDFKGLLIDLEEAGIV